MAVFFWSLFISLLSFFVQVVVWRIKVPKYQVRAIGIIYLSILASVIFCLWIISISGVSVSFSMPESVYEYLHIIAFVVVFLISYIIFFPALEVDAPSLIIVSLVSKAEKDGITIDKIKKVMNDDLLTIPRIDDLKRDKMIYEKDKKFYLSMKSKFFLKVLFGFRKVINHDYKGG